MKETKNSFVHIFDSERKLQSSRQEGVGVGGERVKNRLNQLASLLRCAKWRNEATLDASNVKRVLNAIVVFC